MKPLPRKGEFFADDCQKINRKSGGALRYFGGFVENTGRGEILLLFFPGCDILPVDPDGPGGFAVRNKGG